MQIITKNNTFENNQTTSFLNKLDALIASGYADADDYTRNTAGGNARPTQTSADFTENKLNKTLLIEFIEVLLKATPPEHKNAVEYALTALRYTNKYKLTIPCLLDAFVCGLVKLNVPKNIIKLTTPILCEVLPDTTPELVERKLNEENNGFELEFFSQYLAENYDNFAGKFVDNSWLEMLNNENRLKFEPVEVLEMPPAAETKISQAELATGTDGDLPTQKLASIINNAEADATATANNEMKFKNDYLKMIISQQTNNNNAENDTNVATDATNSASNIKTPPAKTHAKNQSEAFTAKYHKKDYAGYIYSQDPVAEFESILTAYGLIVNKILIENKICRVGTSNNPKGDAGWLKYHTATFYTSKGEELIYLHGVYGNWASGEGTQFVNITNYDFENRNDSAEYLKEMQKIRKQAEKTRAEQVAELEKEIQAEYNKTAEKATFIYESLCDDYDCLYNKENPHDYLKNKNLFVDALAEVFTNIKVINSQKADAYFSYRLAGKGGKLADGEWLVIPIYNKAKNGVRTLQLIDINGNKTMLKGGEAGGGYFEIESNNKTDNYAIVEGVADALALSQVLTNFNVVVAFFATNIIKVVGELVKANSKAKITIFADNDKESKTGEIQAKKAVEAHGGKYIMPPAEYKDFCDFWTAEFANNNGNINAVISIMKNYIDSEISKEISPFKTNAFGVIDRECLGEYSKTKNFHRQKLSRTELENDCDRKDAPIKLTVNNILMAMEDKSFSGMEFAFDTFKGQYVIKRLYKNSNEWEPFKRDNLAELANRIECDNNLNNIFVNHTNLTLYKEAFNIFIEDKNVDTGHELIAKIPKWDGVPRLGNFVSNYLNDTPDVNNDYKEAYGFALFLSKYARLKADPNKGIEIDVGFGLYQKGGAVGKTFFVNHLSLQGKKDGVTNVSLKALNSENSKTELNRKMVAKETYSVDELIGADHLDNETLKNFWTDPFLEFRPLYKDDPVRIARRGIFLITTNENKILSASDTAMQRRFAFLEIDHSYIKEHGHINNKEAGGISENLLQLFAEAQHLYDTNGGDDFVTDYLRKTFLPLIMKNNSQFINDGGDYGDYFDKWADTIFYRDDYKTDKIPVALFDGYKPKDLPGLNRSDIKIFCFCLNDTNFPKKGYNKIINEILKTRGYIETTNSKRFADAITGEPNKYRGFINVNYDANKCHKYEKNETNDIETF